MNTYHYSVSTNTIWTSFDCGDVEAENREQAREKAIAQLKYDFDKANEALKHCDITDGFKVEFDPSQVQITMTNIANTDDIKQFIVNIVESGERTKLQTVKAVKDEYGLGLKEAKDFVDLYFYYKKDDYGSNI